MVPAVDSKFLYFSLSLPSPLRMSDDSTNLASRLANLHIAHSTELLALFNRHRSERDALLQSSPDSLHPSVQAAPVASLSPISAVVVSPATPPPDIASTYMDAQGHILALNDTVRLLTDGRTSRRGDLATVIGFSARKPNWVRIRLLSAYVRTWRAGFNLELVSFPL